MIKNIGLLLVANVSKIATNARGIWRVQSARIDREPSSRIECDICRVRHSWPSACKEIEVKLTHTRRSPRAFSTIE